MEPDLEFDFELILVYIYDYFKLLLKSIDLNSDFLYTKYTKDFFKNQSESKPPDFLLKQCKIA